MFSFCKMQATGNDFIIVDLLKNDISYSFRLLSIFLCDRHYGVGADGILILEKSSEADFKMRIYNKDGTEAEMCGNGIRCLVKYIYEENYLNREFIYIETKSGIKKINLKFDNAVLIEQEVNMGKANFDYDKIPCFYPNKKEDYIKINNYEVYVLSIGNPHAVIFVDDVNEIDINVLGKEIENYKYFPYRINVEFVEKISNKRIKVRIWERGVGETLSCGTGISAVSIVGYKYKNLESEIEIEVKGGIIKTKVSEDEVILIGNADTVFKGKIKI